MYVVCRTSVLGVTTTSISSRERPRAGGIRGCSSANSSPSTTRRAMSQRQPKHQQHATTSGPHLAKTTTSSQVLVSVETPHTRPRSTSRPSMTNSEKCNLLNVCNEKNKSSTACKSWDSGLDMFGAVPFNGPSKQASLYTASQHSPLLCAC